MNAFVLTPSGDWELALVIGRDELRRWTGDELRRFMASFDANCERLGLLSAWNGF